MPILVSYFVLKKSMAGICILQLQILQMSKNSLEKKKIK